MLLAVRHFPSEFCNSNPGAGFEDRAAGARGAAADVTAVAAIRPSTKDATAAPATRPLMLVLLWVGAVRGADSAGMVFNWAMFVPE